MKKRFLVLAALFLAIFLSFSVQAQETEDIFTIAQKAGYPVTPAIVPKGIIALNADNGQVLFAENENAVWDPASTTKTMVVYLTFEAISQGKINMDTQVIATETDQAIARIHALSNNNIVAGQSYSVRELLTMTLVPSSNVATLMLAHLIHGEDDASFLNLMNQTAQQLGMTTTHYYNATGAAIAAFQGYYNPVGYDPYMQNETTAKDLATLNYHLVKKYPEVLQFTNQMKVTVKAGTPLEETFVGYNHSLPGDRLAYEGCDGLKTGSSPHAAYNAVVTAKRGDIRVIIAIMGVSIWDDDEGEYSRHYFTNALFDRIFQNYQKKVIVPAGTTEVNGQKLTTTEDLTALVKEGETLPLSFANNRLQVAGSVDLQSGVAATEARLTTTQIASAGGGQVTGKKNTSSNFKFTLPKLTDKQYLALILGGLGLGVVVLFAGTIVHFKNITKRKRYGNDESEYVSRSRRNR